MISPLRAFRLSTRSTLSITAPKLPVKQIKSVAIGAGVDYKPIKWGYSYTDFKEYLAKKFFKK